MQNKHIIRLSFLGIFLGVIVNIILYRQFTLNEVILREISNNNKNLISIYTSQIWNFSSSVVKKHQNADTNRRLIDNNFVNFLEKTSEFFKEANTLKVQIFGRGNKILFDSNDIAIEAVDEDMSNFYEYYSTKLDYRILKRSIIHDALSKAYSGVIVDTIFPKVILKSSDSVTRRANLVVNYFPIKDYKGDVDVVIVLYSDVTSPWTKLGVLEREVCAVLIVLFTFFFGVIIHNTSYAQKVIDKQLQINRLLEEAKARAEDENRSKSDFLANVSHELRTPLNIIIGYSEIMLSAHSTNVKPEENENRVSHILAAGRHLLSVINDILDYSKVAADKLQVEMIDVDIGKMAKSTLSFFEQKASESGINLVAEIPESHCIIKVDPRRLKQAIINLLSNSLKFTREGGSIKINVSKNIEKRKIYIRIIDTGIGIAEKDIPKALSSFGQVDNSLSRKYEGTGLGLPLTKKLIELMNGKFEVSSIENVGTTITLTFDYSESMI